MPLVLSGSNGISTNGTSWALQPDSAGRVTMPYQPAFYGGRSGGDVAANTIFTMNFAYTNTGNHYNTSTGIFTCPVAGRYIVSFSVMTPGSFSSSQDMFTIQLNGLIYTANYMTSNGQPHQRLGGTVILNCSANDQIAFATRAVTMYGASPAHSYGTIHLLG